MKRILLTTLGIVGIAFGFAMPDNEPITIVLKPSDITQYQKYQSNISRLIDNSDLTGKQITYIKAQMDSSTLVLLKNVKPLDTVKKK